MFKGLWMRSISYSVFLRRNTSPVELLMMPSRCPGAHWGQGGGVLGTTPSVWGLDF